MNQKTKVRIMKGIARYIYIYLYPCHFSLHNDFAPLSLMASKVWTFEERDEEQIVMPYLLLGCLNV